VAVEAVVVVVVVVAAEVAVAEVADFGTPCSCRQVGNCVLPERSARRQSALA